MNGVTDKFSKSSRNGMLRRPVCRIMIRQRQRVSSTVRGLFAFTHPALFIRYLIQVCFPFDHHRFPYTVSAFFKLEFSPELLAALLPEYIFSSGFALCQRFYIGRGEFFPVEHLPDHETTAAVLWPPVRTSVTSLALDDFSVTDRTDA